MKLVNLILNDLNYRLFINNTHNAHKTKLKCLRVAVYWDIETLLIIIKISK